MIANKDKRRKQCKQQKPINKPTNMWGWGFDFGSPENMGIYSMQKRKNKKR